MNQVQAQPGVSVHGDRNLQELEALGLAQVPLLDFAVNLNPFGPPPFLLTALREVDIVEYPDRTSQASRQAIGSALGVEPAAIALGNGACELLWSLARLWRGQTALMIEPTFSEFAEAMRAEGGRVVSVQAPDCTTLAMSSQAVSEAIATHHPAVVYICNPNNPTGGFSELQVLRAMAHEHPAVTFVIDESFLSLSEHADGRFEVIGNANVVRVRSLTKDFSIAGVRVGYLVADPALIRRLEAQRPPWTVSRLAQEAAIVAVSAQAESWLAQARAALASLREDLRGGLSRLGMNVLPSSVNFVVAHVARSATALRHELLLRHHVVVRDCTSFGLPQHIRLCVRAAPDQQKLLEAMRGL